jgi:hypothetical protein
MSRIRPPLVLTVLALALLLYTVGAPFNHGG